MMTTKPTRKTTRSAAYVRGLILQSDRYEGESDWQASVTDLLADIQHFSLVHRVDFREALRVSRDHFDYETSNLQREDEAHE
jgi:hypothetical protein